MPMLLHLTLAVLAQLPAWLVMQTNTLWARYASGRARRRAHGWVERGTPWLLALCSKRLAPSRLLCRSWAILSGMAS